MTDGHSSYQAAIGSKGSHSYSLLRVDYATRAHHRVWHHSKSTNISQDMQAANDNFTAEADIITKAQGQLQELDRIRADEAEDLEGKSRQAEVAAASLATIPPGTSSWPTDAPETVGDGQSENETWVDSADDDGADDEGLLESG